MSKFDYELLIFDWDGTLVDSIDRIVRSMCHAAESCGLSSRDDESIKGIIGLGLPEAIASLYPELREPAVIERFRRFYSEYFLESERMPSPLFEGVEAALDAFRASGYKLAVATGKSRRGLDRVLEARGWSDYFDITRCADETASKPDPLMINEILAYCRSARRRALMIGDSSFDLLMAQRAGVDCVAVGYGAQSLDALRALEPTVAITTFSELPVWLETGSIGRGC